MGRWDMHMLAQAAWRAEHTHLLRRQPHRERARIVLNEDAKEALQAAKDGTVDHDRALPLCVAIDVRHVKALRQVVVQLNGRALPLAANRILDPARTASVAQAWERDDVTQVEGISVWVLSCPLLASPAPNSVKVHPPDIHRVH